MVLNYQHISIFVEGKHILNAILIGNEAIDSKLKSSISGVICKIDIEKVYDHANWEFLLVILEKSSFGHKWIIWFKTLNHASPQQNC